MVGIYFSGTGNTRFCVETFMKKIHGNNGAYSIENAAAVEAIRSQDIIVFGYPVYFSNLPKIVRDFIKENARGFKGKKIFIIATMGLFSGDGTGCSARLFQKAGAEIVGGLHVKMPDCIGDEKALKKPLERNKELIKAAEAKIQEAVQHFNNGEAPREGLNLLYHLAGLFGQRLWFYHKTKTYTDKVKVDSEKCIGCGVCINVCPMDNLALENGKAVSKGKCTMCYRCFSDCPKQAITILGRTVYEQCKLEKYV